MSFNRISDFETSNNIDKFNYFRNINSVSILNPKVSEKFNGDGRHYLKVNIMGIKMVGLLDSGANCTVLGKDAQNVIKTLKLDVFNVDTNIKTADGTVHAIKSYINLPFEYNGKCFVLPTLVFPNLAQTLILGIDFWNRFNLKPCMCEETCVELLELNDNLTLDNEKFELSSFQLQKLNEVKQKFPYSTSTKIGRTSLVSHVIETGECRPIKQRYYPVSPYVQKSIDDELDRMLSLGVIEKSVSPWSSPMVCVKKSSGKIRLCLDSRKLNDCTKKDAYPLPYISNILGRFSGTKYLSTIDLSDAFWQVPLEYNSKEKTAFTIPGRGLYQFIVMPFGLCNAPQTQSRLMDRVLGADLEPFVFAYLDDIVVACDDFDQHCKLLEEVALRLKAANLTISPEKSKFCCPKIKYLGYVVDKDGLHTDPDKVSSIVNYPAPKSIKEIRRFVGMASWYRRFIDNFSSKLAPVTELLKNNGKNRFIWTEQANCAFLEIKSALISAPVLSNPDFDKEFCIQTDASDVGMGAVLCQDDKVIAFMSQKFTSAERKYNVTERECLAVLTAIEKFRAYIEGAKFQVITDHSSLIWLLKLNNPVGRLGRWALKLQQYNYDITHRKGKFNDVADALSRSVEMIEIKGNLEEVDTWYENLKLNITNSPELYPTFKIVDNNIFKLCRWKDDLGIIQNVWKRVITRVQRKNILFKAHDDTTSGHLGYFKTLNRIVGEFYWPNMFEEIKDYINKCEVCKASKVPNVTMRPQMGKQRKVERPWKMISIDYMGPFIRSKKGNTMLLVITDHFTKFPLLFPLRDAKANQLIKILEEQVFFIFGYPQVIITDNGSQFTARIFKQFLAKYGVQHWSTPNYHPQANPTERVNKVIGNAIRAYIGKDHRCWDEEIQKIGFAIRTAKHETTRFSPFYLNFGREISLENKSEDKNNENHLENLSHLTEAFRMVKENLEKAHERDKKRYNLRSQENKTFKKGDFVWRKNYILSDAAKGINSKFCPKFIKCKISDCTGSNTYLIEDLNGKKLGVYSGKDLQYCYR